jgi:hypothetical protein
MVMRLTWILLGVAGVAAGCASVLAIPSDTPSFCAQPANQGHAYCEDFDVGDPSTRWTYVTATAGATYTVEPSDQSPPNLLDMSAPTQPGKTSALVGFDKEFDDSTFVGLHIEADVRFVTQNNAPLSANGGFLLIVDKSGGCIGLGLATPVDGGMPTGIGAQVAQESTACSSLTGGGSGTGGMPLMGSQITEAPAPNTWFHLVVIVAPDPTGLPGAGTLSVNIVGQPDSPPLVHLIGGTLVASGIPLVGFAAEVNGPSGPLEVQFDNITIDLRPN